MSLMHRLSSFERWPTTAKSPCSLANAGFYYTGHGDKVICPECNLEIEGWSDRVFSPREEHRTRSPGCPFVTSNNGTTALIPVYLYRSTGSSRIHYHQGPLSIPVQPSDRDASSMLWIGRTTGYTSHQENVSNEHWRNDVIEKTYSITVRQRHVPETAQTMGIVVRGEGD